MDAFRTIRHARALRERHPDAPPSVVHVAVLLASYADGKTGTSIRPGEQRLRDVTGLGRSTIRRALRWLEAHGEIRLDKPGSRGSAACYSWQFVVPGEPPTEQFVVPPAQFVAPGEPPLTKQEEQEPEAPQASAQVQAGPPLDNTPEVCPECGADEPTHFPRLVSLENGSTGKEPWIACRECSLELPAGVWAAHQKEDA